MGVGGVWPRRLPAFLALVLLASAGRLAAAPQLQVSPGPLSRAHAKLEGIANCTKCHDAGRTLSAEKCLGCHKPIAERMASRKGVHRAVAGGCAKCHVEHRGADADSRRLDRQTFDHAAETGFVLDGRHAAVASKCEACHKTRSFLAARTACESCHADVHKGALGRDCAKCHRTTVEFKQTRAGFDHATARFTLTGAHRDTACEKCHVNKVFRGLPFEDCAPCHKFAHRRAMARTCATCHVTERWLAAAQGFDHTKTGFTLAGSHARVACAKCHAAGVRAALAHDRCAACHTNPHRESIKDDCGKCHDETSFKKGKFDHAVRTGFALAAKHDGLACAKCHKALGPADAPAARRLVDFGGASRDCASCHKDEHKGEFGRYCESCHTPTTFKVAAFVHPRTPEFFAGAHKGLACAKCHVRRADAPGSVTGAEAGAPPAPPGRGAPPSPVCSTCHADVHLGQVGPACDRCHAVDAPKFAPARFSHDTAAFKLAGKHGTTPCVKCHPSQTAAFPSGTGTAKRLKPVEAECRACHKDPHLGQVEGSCGRCHAPSTFKMARFNHVGLENLMGVATHSRIPCRSCHKTETGQFPAGWGTAMRLKVGRTCLECHP